METTSLERSAKRLRAARDHVTEWHNRLWPGVEIQRLRSKYVKLNVVQHNTQQQWFNEATIPTSVLMSIACHFMSFKFLQLTSRAASCTGFGKLITFIASSTDGFNLSHHPFGSQTEIDLTVDNVGFVDASQFWSPEFWQSEVQGLWERDFQHEGKTWVDSADGIGRVPLSSLLSFALDPQHPANLTQQLASRVYNLITEIAYILDSSVDLLGRERTELKVSTVKSKHRHRKILCSVYAERAVNKLWSGEVSWVEPENDLLVSPSHASFYCRGLNSGYSGLEKNLTAS